MKISIILIGLGLWLLMLVLITTADAQTVVHQTYPGTSVRDFNKPSYVIRNDGTGYQTYPGTSVRDFNAPGFKVERNAGTYAPAPVFIPPLRRQRSGFYDTYETSGFYGD